MIPIIPQPLKPGATIGVVAPGSPPQDEERIRKGIAWLQERGYRIVEGASLGLRDGYLNGPDEARTADIHAMFADTQIDAIFCTRGGYGCTRLLPLLDYELIRANPKPFMGFSDITALHAAFMAKAGLVSFAGPMVAVEMRYGMMNFTFEHWERVLFRTESAVRMTLPEHNPTGYSHPGKARGPLIGGNLAVFASLIGTPYMPDAGGCVLYLEEVGEQVYRIDRMLSHLRNAGILQKLSGAMLGAFTSIPETAPDRALSAVIEEYFSPLGIPVLDGLPFGHVPDKITLPVGAVVEVDVGERTLKMDMEAAGAPNPEIDP